MKSEIADELITQFDRAWKTLKEIVDKTPESEWTNGIDDYLIPVRLVYHILSAADLYATQMGYEEYKPHRGYKSNWETTPVQALPSKEMTLACIEKTGDKVKDWIRDLGDKGLLKPQDDYDWTGKCPLGRGMYVLMHTQLHIGEINSELRRRRLEGGRW